ncbi:MAG: hypothetical protein NTV86_19150, partial [Planctomycetota bacterium]|nr:hypothetical protein [Planctomycetota bacterium]
QEMAVVHAEACMTAMSVTPPRVPDSQNAALLYRRAAELMKSDTGWEELVGHRGKPDTGQFNPTDEKMLAFLTGHADWLELVRRAGDLAGYDDDLQLNPPSNQTTRLPDVSSFIALGDCVQLSAKANAHAGRLVEATKDVAALFNMARLKTTEPLLYSGMAAMAVERRGFEAFQDVLDAGPVPPEALDGLRIDPQTAFQPAFHREVTMEECFGIVMFSEIPAKNATVDDMRKTTRRNIFTFCQNPLYRVFLWQGDLESYRNVIDPQRQLAGKPYYETADAWKRLGKDQGPARMGGMLAGLITPVFAFLATDAAQADAQHRLALLAIAACRYHNARGAWPETLAALVPSYLPAMPTDPFTGKPLLLARAPDGRPILYSIGRDMVDDGGKPFDRKTDKGDIRLVLPAK